MMKDKPDRISLCLVDGDIQAYRAAYVALNKDLDLKGAQKLLNEYMGEIINETVVFTTEDNFKVFITGSSNFRDEIFEDYKGQREEEDKPILVKLLREHLQSYWMATESVNCEADDLICIAHTKHNRPETTVIASTDKDFKTIDGWIYNTRFKTWKYSTKEDALKFFYTQCLMGDKVDNIQGIYGIGVVTAEKILEGLTTEEELFEAVRKTYIEKGLFHKDLLITGRLLHLQRYEGELWEFPSKGGKV